MNSLKTLAMASAMAFLTLPATAAEHEIRMLNSGAGGQMVFEPSLLRIQAGDTVTFRAAHKGHNAQSIEVIRPDGGTSFRGKMNEEIAVTFEKEGVYGYECKPHYGLGMVGLIVVGDASPNLAKARESTHRGKAKERFEHMFKHIGP